MYINSKFVFGTDSFLPRGLRIWVICFIDLQILGFHIAINNYFIFIYQLPVSNKKLADYAVSLGLRGFKLFTW